MHKKININFLFFNQGPAARSEATTLANSIQLAAEMLPLPEDRLIALTEAASILGAVGACRKRVLLMWQAVELSKYFGFPDARTLAVAREALEPATQHAQQQHPLAGSGNSFSSMEWWSTPTNNNNNNTNSTCRKSLATRDTDMSIPLSWGPVRAGCLEAVLGLSIYAKRHADVWDAAAALLRDHTKDLSPHRMQSLMDNLVAAASQMVPQEKNRAGAGPPPLLHALAPRSPPLALAPIWIEQDLNAAAASVQSPSARQGLFLYDPFSARRQKQRGQQRTKAKGDDGTTVHWVCGETASIDIEVANPASVSIKIDKMVLEATFRPLNETSQAVDDVNLNSTVVPATKAVWKAKPVSLNIPAHTKPVRIQLEGTPLAPGTLTLTGCKLTAFGGVTWSQPWLTRPLNLAKTLAELTKKGSIHHYQHDKDSSSTVNGSSNGIDTNSNSTAVPPPPSSSSSSSVHHHPRVTILPPLPRLQISLQPGTNDATALSIESPPPPPPPPSIKTMRLLQGHSLQASLLIVNSGTVAVTTLRVGLSHETITTTTTTTTTHTAASKKVAVTVDTSLLEANLPLQPGQSFSLPVEISAAGGGGGGGRVGGGVHNDGSSSSAAALLEDACTEVISVEYAGGDSSSSSTTTTTSLPASPLSYAAAVMDGLQSSAAGGGGGNQIPGRRSTLEVSIAVSPSLYISHIEFSEVYCCHDTVDDEGEEVDSMRSAAQSRGRKMMDQMASASTTAATTGGGSNSSGSSSTARVLMKAEAVNRGGYGVEAWLGPSSSSSSSSSSSLFSAPSRPTAVASSDTADEDGGGGSRNKSEGGVVFIGPGQRAVLSYFVDANESMLASAAGSDNDTSSTTTTTTTDGQRGAGVPQSHHQHNQHGRPGVVPVRFEEKERQECSAALAHHIALYFQLPPPPPPPQRDTSSTNTTSAIDGGHVSGAVLSSNNNNNTSAADGAAPPPPLVATPPTATITTTSFGPPTVPGVVPLIQGEIYNGLGLSTLSMLRPCAVIAQITATPLHSSSLNDDGVDGEGRNNAVVKYSHVPMVDCSLGQPLKISIEFYSQLDEDVTLHWSLFCAHIALLSSNTSGGGGGNTTTTAAAHLTLGGGGGDFNSPSSMGAAIAAAAAASSQQNTQQHHHRHYTTTTTPTTTTTTANHHHQQHYHHHQYLPLYTGGTTTLHSVEVPGTTSQQHPMYIPTNTSTLSFGGAGGGGGFLQSPLSTGGGGAAAWSGSHIGVQLTVPARGKVSQVAGVAIVLPGMYRIGLSHVNVGYSNSGEKRGGAVLQKNSLVEVRPCFLDVGEK